MYSFIDKCTLFCYFNKTVADEVCDAEKVKLPHGQFGCLSDPHPLFVSSFAL